MQQCCNNVSKDAMSMYFCSFIANRSCNTTITGSCCIR